MKTIKERTNKGYEIVLYYPKDHGQYTSQTGNVKEVVQCENVGEVAQWFARNSWGSPYGDSDYANPTVFFDGKPWCKGEYTEVKTKYHYVIVWDDDYPPCYFDTYEEAARYLDECENIVEAKGTIEEREN